MVLYLDIMKRFSIPKESSEPYFGFLPQSRAVALLIFVVLGLLIIMTPSGLLFKFISLLITFIISSVLATRPHGMPFIKFATIWWFYHFHHRLYVFRGEQS